MAGIVEIPRYYCFVLPRFGREIAGGAETLSGALAEKLSERGDRVEVLTTCARDNRTWANELAAGRFKEDGIDLYRFPVDERNLDVWIPIQLSVQDGIIPSLERQLDWMQHSVSSAALYQHLAANAARYSAIFLAPYLFGTTFWGSMIAPERSVLIPCLHDEVAARTEVMGSMFRQVRGCLFNSSPEGELAGRFYGDIRGGEVGMGFEPILEPEGLGPFFADPFPYILYIGRKETGKNVQQLLDYFIAAKDEGLLDKSLKLVVAGGGSFTDLHRPRALQRSDVIDLAHLSEREKQRLIRYALFVCQPSINESFSIVIMEAWLLSVPVVVHAGCAVTRDHVVRSGGGLYFSDGDDFAGVTAALFNDGALRASLAEKGRAYVHERYSWGAVLKRFDKVMEELEH